MSILKWYFYNIMPNLKNMFVAIEKYLRAYTSIGKVTPEK